MLNNYVVKILSGNIPNKMGLDICSLASAKSADSQQSQNDNEAECLKKRAKLSFLLQSYILVLYFIEFFIEGSLLLTFIPPKINYSFYLMGAAVSENIVKKQNKTKKNT